VCVHVYLCINIFKAFCICISRNAVLCVLVGGRVFSKGEYWAGDMAPDCAMGSLSSMFMKGSCPNGVVGLRAVECN